MISYQSKAQIFTNLVNIFEEELEWIINKQYTSEPHYKALYNAIQDMADEQPDDLQETARYLGQKLQELSVYIGEKMKNMIDLSFNEVHNLRQKMAESEQQIRNLRDKVQSLEQSQESLNDKLSTWERQYDILKAEALEMQQKLQMEVNRIKTEKKELKRTFLQVQQQTEEERKMIQNLQTEKIQINELIQQHKKQKQMLLEEIDMLKKKVQLAERKVQSSEGKYQYSGKKIAMLEEQIQEKNHMIEQFYQSQRPKIQSLKQKQVQLLTQIIKNDITSNESIINRVTSEVQSFKLGQLVQINSEEYEMEYKRTKSNHTDQDGHSQILKINYSTIAEDPVQEEQKQDFKKQPLIPDLYYAHYLLIVQSIKLKKNRQEYFQIDMSHFYKELLMKAVPFHKWDDWISQKLQNQINNRK